MTTRPCKGTCQANTNTQGGHGSTAREPGKRTTKAKDPSIHSVSRAAPENGLKEASRRRSRRRARIIIISSQPAAISLVCVSYLRLREAEGGRELRPLRQGEVLRPLKPALQLLDLQRRVDCPGLPHLLPFAVDPCQFAILYRLFNVICNDRWARERSI